MVLRGQVMCPNSLDINPAITLILQLKIYSNVTDKLGNDVNRTQILHLLIYERFHPQKTSGKCKKAAPT